MTRGEVWWADLPAPAGRRPVVLLHRDEAYEVLTSYVAAEVTRTVRGLPSGVLLTPADGMPRRCEVNLDTVRQVRRERLVRRITSLRREKVAAIDDALRFVLAL